MKDELDKLLAAGKIGRQHVDPLLQLVQCGYCMHRSWGFGKITTVDTVFSRLLIDFQSKPGHSMDLAFSAESLKPIPQEHILARKVADLAGLKQMAALQHLDLIRLVLNSFGGSATLDQIQQVLVPDVIEADWRKWWDSVKREMRKDGHFIVPLKKSEPVVYVEAQVSIQDRLLKEFRGAMGLKARLLVAQEIFRALPELTEAPAAVAEVTGLLNADILSHQKTMPALALEAVFMRDELRKATGGAPAEGELTDATLWSQELDYGRIFDAMPAAKHKQALQSFRATFPDQWDTLVLGFLNDVSARLCGEVVRLLIDAGKTDLMKEHVARLINQHSASSEMLLWLAKGRSDAFADILGPEVFRAMLAAMERDQFSEKKSNRLGDYILSDTELLVELIGTADLDVVKDLTRTLQFSPVFDDMDKRSLLARIVKSYPSVQALITGDQPSKSETGLVVSWASLERRRKEYDELVHKRIPANSREIAVARSYGDLRENHEYKAAKEMHRLLMQRKAELESQLVRARGSDFAEATSDAVSIGTVVRVHEVGTDNQETLVILGAWDSDPERGVVSYLSPIAQALIGKKSGEEAEFEHHGARRHYRIEAIQVHRPPETEPDGPIEKADSEVNAL